MMENFLILFQILLIVPDRALNQLRQNITIFDTNLQLKFRFENCTAMTERYNGVQTLLIKVKSILCVSNCTCHNLNLPSFDAV